MPRFRKPVRPKKIRKTDGTADATTTSPKKFTKPFGAPKFGGNRTKEQPARSGPRKPYVKREDRPRKEGAEVVEGAGGDAESTRPPRKEKTPTMSAQYFKLYSAIVTRVREKDSEELQSLFTKLYSEVFSEAILAWPETIRSRLAHPAASRALQLLLKWGEVEIRSKVIRLMGTPCTMKEGQLVHLKDGEPEQFALIKELANNGPGSRLLLKGLRYASPTDRLMLHKALERSLQQITFTRFGSQVVEYVYCSETRRHQEEMKHKGAKCTHSDLLARRIIYGAFLRGKFLDSILALSESKSHGEILASLSEDQTSDELPTRPQYLALLDQAVDRCLDKNVLSRLPSQVLLGMHIASASDESRRHWAELLFKPVEDEQPEAIAKLDENLRASKRQKSSMPVVGLLNSKEGIEIVSQLVGFASAKEKKKFVSIPLAGRDPTLKKSILDFIDEGAGVVLLRRLLASVDDTKLSAEKILTPLMSEARRICESKVARKIVLGILCPTKKKYCLDCDILGFPDNSKKSIDKKCSELLPSLSHGLLTLINSLGEDLVPFLTHPMASDCVKEAILASPVFAQQLLKVIPRPHELATRDGYRTLRALVNEQTADEAMERLEADEILQLMRAEAGPLFIADLFQMCKDSPKKEILLKRSRESIGEAADGPPVKKLRAVLDL